MSDAAAIAMGIAVGPAFADSEGYSDESFRGMLKVITISEVLMACRSVECRMTWGANFAETMARKRKVAQAPNMNGAKRLY